MQGRDPLYDNIPGCGVDPRNLAQRIMAVCIAVTSLAVLIAFVASEGELLSCIAEHCGCSCCRGSATAAAAMLSATMQIGPKLIA